jgi:hypothetical protein
MEHPPVHVIRLQMVWGKIPVPLPKEVMTSIRSRCSEDKHDQASLASDEALGEFGLFYVNLVSAPTDLIPERGFSGIFGRCFLQEVMLSGTYPLGYLVYYVDGLCPVGSLSRFSAPTHQTRIRPAQPVSAEDMRSQTRKGYPECRTITRWSFP